MKQFVRIKLLTILLLLSCVMLFAQIPDGGISLIKETIPNYTKSGKGILLATTITGQPFTKGFKVTTGADVSSTWDSQVTFTNTNGIEAKDVVLVAFYARTISSMQETGEGAVTVCIEKNTDPYEKELYFKIPIGRDWKQYYASVKCTTSLAISAVRYAFHCGYLSQSIEIADVKFLNYKNTLTLEQLPVTEIKYSGREADAPWRAEAAERIDKNRKGIADVVVYDENGQVVKDATVSVEMVRHKFGFGSAVDVKTFLSNAVYRKKVYELFNEVVLENDLKWNSFNPSLTLNIKKTLDSLERHQIPVRGHNVIWPTFRENLPYLKTLSADPVAFRNEIDKHIDQVTQFAKGRVIDWDVLNEPVTNTEFQKILGDEVMADWFKRVRQNDRNVKLFINDYSILSGGGIDVKHQDGYFNTIKYIDEKGGKIEGIGMQGHFGSDLTPIPKLYTILERFASLGKEIKITEHDINITQRAVQADYTRDFMTMVFSHASVKSILTWGFWSKQHWFPDAAFYNTDWTLRPHGEAWKDLVFNQWWTKKTDLTTNSEGKVSLDGFLGTYKYTIKSGDKVRTGTFKIDNSRQSGIGNPIILSFDSTIPDNVSITTTQPTCLCEGENVTLQASTGTDLKYQWYRGTELLPEQTSALVASQSGTYSVKVKKGTVELTSAPIEVKVTPVPQAPVIKTTGDLAFCPNEKVNFNTAASNDLTYNWYKGTTKIQGSVTSLDVNQSGSYSLQVNAYGCTAKSEPITVQVYSATSSECTTGFNEWNNSIRVYPNPFSGSFVLETGNLNNTPTTIELFNALGARIFSNKLDQTISKTIVQVPNPGFYTLRVSNNKEVQIFKVVGN